MKDLAKCQVVCEFGCFCIAMNFEAVLKKKWGALVKGWMLIYGDDTQKS